ncbi:hypothetical protein HUK80_17910 [Flavobacterium sp. MAH-1]|uniref:DUF5655 domain-containing protein n=2 Tax=Flavobacterium agri TaxID=2743471 RepID=A0A7Y8Y5G2_9FLAO|nr:hypothetical protein [Flavobacterium agri]NYA72801.1 hypothetical protein [Flavobacterium agri]
MTRKEHWKNQLNNYTELIEKYKWKQEPMLELVKLFLTNGISELFFPSNSHAALGLSKFANYPLRTEHNMVFISYDQDEDIFKIYFYRGKKNDWLFKKETTVVEDKDINRIKYWLNLI